MPKGKIYQPLLSNIDLKLKGIFQEDTREICSESFLFQLKQIFLSVPILIFPIPESRTNLIPTDKLVSSFYMFLSPFAANSTSSVAKIFRAV